MKKYIFFTAALLILTQLWAQEGELDLSFNGNGKYLLDLSYDDEATSVYILQDEKILIGGVTQNSDTDMMVVKLDRYGNPDLTFGNLGITEIVDRDSDERLTDLTVQPDSKIVLLGRYWSGPSSGCLLSRLNANGSLDYTFADSGEVHIDGWYGSSYWNSLVALPNGKIVVAGYAYFQTTGVSGVLMGFNADGSRDYSFGDSSLVKFSLSGSSVNLHKIELDYAGNLLLTGSGYSQGNRNILVARLFPNGTFDQSFGGNGISLIPYGDNADGADLAMYANGKFAVAGTVYINGQYQLALARLNNDGTLDQSFGTNGKVNTPILDGNVAVVSVAILGDGKILVAGSADGIWNKDFALVRYRTDGTLDKSFSYDGIATKNLANGYDDANDASIQPNGRMVIVGTSFGNSSSSSVITAARFLGGTGTIGLDELHSTYTFDLFPNPANDWMGMELMGDNRAFQVQLINQSGKVVYKNVDFNSNERIDVSALAPGLYIMQLQAANLEPVYRKIQIL